MKRPPCPAQWVAAAWISLIGCAAGTVRAAEKQDQPPALDVVLERVPPMSPEESLANIEVADGFRVELVAAEPLVVDPVAMAFDEDGRLYVVEMCDYSEQDKERLGRVRVLVDENGDGRFDTSSVLVEDLSWPTAVACYDGGVFVGAAPDILYCKDTTGDGVADEQRVVLTGFGRGNVQGLLNSFQWGLDARIHGATSSAGGQITRPQQWDQEQPLELRGRDFAFDPRTLAIEATTGGGQHGLSFNRWGERFVCSNSDHLQAIVFEERYLARNPYQSVVSAMRSIAADGPQATVYRISPVEAWRVARTELRVAGQVPGPIEAGGRAAGYFTGATGVTLYEGGLWGDDQDWVYVADVGGNLIHRKKLVPDGVTYRGERVDHQSEFLASRDIWFRPVQMAIGPDGALYIADMYREVIEHPDSLPPVLKRQLDLTSGRDRGRIYRVVPADYQHAPPPSLASASTSELVDELAHGNAWRRATAARLLYERQDTSAIELLGDRLRRVELPEGRIAVLYALRSLAAVGVDDLMLALSDAHPQVRRHALRLSEPLLDRSAELRAKALSLIDDAEPIVQFQLALSLGQSGDPQAADALAEVMVRNAAEQDIVGAALTSIHSKAGAVLKRLLAEEGWLSKPEARPVVAAIVAQIARQRRQDDLAGLVRALRASGGEVDRAGAAALLLALSRLPADALEGGDSPWLAELAALRQSAAADLIADARRLLEQDDVPLEQRVLAVEALGLDSFANQRALLGELLSPQEPATIHRAVLTVCAEFDEPEVAELVLARWQEFAPPERTQATELLLRREVWTVQLLSRLTEDNVPLTTLDPSHVARLEIYPSDRVRRLALALGDHSASDDRQQVFESYRETVASENGDPERGKLVFERHCAACHELAGTGHAVGPNLAAMIHRGTDSLLFNILAPNAEVEPRYLEYVLVTVDGQVHSGMIAGETSTAVTLRGADHKTTTVLRVDIEELHNTGRSLMPEGFENLIDPPAMADLLAYLRQAAEGASQ